MKKLLAVASILVIATSLFAAPKAKKVKQVTLNIMGYGDNSNAEGQTFKRICEEFMDANPDVKVNYELLYDEAYHQNNIHPKHDTGLTFKKILQSHFARTIVIIWAQR